MEGVKPVLHCFQRPFLVMEEESTTSKETTTKDLSSHHRICSRNDNQESCRKSEKANKMAIKALYSTQERHRQVEDHSRSVTPQQIHSVSHFQNAYSERSKDAPPSTPLHSIIRSERRVLARSNNSKEETLSGVRVQEHHIPIQSHAIRSQYCSKNIYEANCSRIKVSRREKHLHVGILRRPSDSFSFLPSMPTTSTNSNRDSTILGMDYQREEVKNRTSTSVPMVGSQVGLNSFQLLHSHGYSDEVRTTNPTSKDIYNDNKKRDHASSGTNKLGFFDKLQHKVPNVSNKERVNKNKKTFLRFCLPTSKVLQDRTNSPKEQPFFPIETRNSRLLHQHYDRCFERGMGNQVPTSTDGRLIRQFHDLKGHSHKRTHCDFLGFTSSDRVKDIHQDTHRLPGVSPCSKKRLLQEHNSRPTSLSDLVISPEEVPRPSSFFPSREIQSPCRSTLKRDNNIHRVGYKRKRLSTSFERIQFHTSDRSFATDLNKKYSRYLSTCPDLQATAIDAFNCSWSQWDYLYLFPPTPLI